MRRRRNPGMVDRTKTTAVPHTDLHGYCTMHELMVDLNPLSGGLYLEALIKEFAIRGPDDVQLMVMGAPEPRNLAYWTSSLSRTRCATRPTATRSPISGTQSAVHRLTRGID